MKKFASSVLGIMDTLAPIIIGIVLFIDFVAHFGRLGAMTALIRLIVLCVSALGLRLCIVQIISGLSQKTFSLGQIIEDYQMMIEYQDLLDELDNPTGCIELDIMEDDAIYPNPKVCVALLLDKNSHCITMMSCPVRRTDGIRRIGTFDVKPGVHRFYKISDMNDDNDDGEPFGPIYCEERILSLTVRAILASRREEGPNAPYEAMSYIIDNSKGCLTCYGLIKKPNYMPEYIGPHAGDL